MPCNCTYSNSLNYDCSYSGPRNPEGRSAGCIMCGKCNKFPVLDTFFKRGFSSVEETQKREGFGIAVDIGTTTVVMALLDLKAGSIIVRHSFFNPQQVYGGDVISRIQAANDGHLEKLRLLITESLIKGTGEIFLKSGINHLDEIVIAGNTVMIHLLLGFSCESLGASPFKVNQKLKSIYAFKEIFPLYNERGASFAVDSLLPVRILPWFSAFVGGDIVSGLLSVLLEKKKIFMLLDLGTNGEIALFNDNRVTVTSCAAGPAFEGHGGASQVIAELAELIREKKIDETGLIAKEESGCPVKKMFFSQKQIRGLQLAKSAVRSAVDILLEESGLNYESIEKVYIAGGIGQAVNPQDAVITGLIPKELAFKCAAVGNASLAGAVRMLVSPLGANKDASSLLSDFKEINLGGHPRFNDLFAGYMFFS